MEYCYYRVTFTVYWSDSAPSTEVFYLIRRPWTMNPDVIDRISDQVKSLMKVYHGEIRVTGVIYVGGEVMDEMSEADIKRAGWRVTAVVDCADRDEGQTVPPVFFKTLRSDNYDEASE